MRFAGNILKSRGSTSQKNRTFINILSVNNIRNMLLDSKMAPFHLAAADSWPEPAKAPTGGDLREELPVSGFRIMKWIRKGCRSSSQPG
jgi:hypothetical protein